MSYKQLVVFLIGEEEYGIEISFAQEILRIPEQIAKMPNMPAYLEGLTILRGNVIPIINLRKMFTYSKLDAEHDGRLLVVRLQNELVGMLVDDVSEVLNIEEEAIEGITPEISGDGNNCLKGIGKKDGRIILLIDDAKLKSEIF